VSKVRRQSNGRWLVDWVDETGRRQRRSLGSSVTTKAAAEELLAELVTTSRRRALGLEAAAVSTKVSVWDLCEWWLRHRCPEASHDRELVRLTKHVKGSRLGSMRASKVRKLDVADHLDDLEASGLAPASVNHVRAKLRAVFEAARKADAFSGPNPVKETEPRRVPKRHFATLSADEVPVMLRFVAPEWRPFFACAVYLGLRKGEIAGLRKADVDLDHLTVYVRHSYERAGTKGGHDDMLPIPPQLRPYIDQGLATPGPYLFPDAKGHPRGPECDPHLRLRTALKLAGIVDGYRVTCRWCTHEGREQLVDVEQLHATQEKAFEVSCARHPGRRLWVTAVPRHLRFHDLRHTTATVLLRSGVDAHRVQRIMRHASITTTTGTYGHLLVDDLREGLKGLEGVRPRATPELVRQFVAWLAGRENAAEIRQGSGTDDSTAPTREGANHEEHDENSSAARGIRTPDPRLRRPSR